MTDGMGREPGAATDQQHPKPAEYRTFSGKKAQGSTDDEQAARCKRGGNHDGGLAIETGEKRNERNDRSCRESGK